MVRLRIESNNESIARISLSLVKVHRHKNALNYLTVIRNMMMNLEPCNNENELVDSDGKKPASTDRMDRRKMELTAYYNRLQCTKEIKDASETGAISRNTSRTTLVLTAEE